MPSPHPIAVLIVSAGTEDALRDLADRLGQRGATVQRVSDVYAAMASLSRLRGKAYVLLDVRHIDRVEAAFATQAPRYYPAIELIVPILEGAIDAVADHAPGLRSATVEGILQAIATDLEQEALFVEPPRHVEAHPMPEATVPFTDDEEGVEAPPSPIAESVAGEDACEEHAPAQLAVDIEPVRLSTDGGPEETEQGPALHEAVRIRMAGDDPRAIRRTPPIRTAPTGPKAPARGPSLLREELDALLNVAPADLTPTTQPEGGPS